MLNPDTIAIDQGSSWTHLEEYLEIGLISDDDPCLTVLLLRLIVAVVAPSLNIEPISFAYQL